ncbi:uncharacterized protein OCT59_005039 [Rhizophagus irregularis]|uniref:uncharacterized protein n=1 Tax=Rhizophagus irregularis TaxID=588596 RepID=UPI00332A0276|nr:hypothetical protein OCT59_005039 [Rhizophagus irregularis]
MNSTIFGVKEQNKNKLEFLFKPLPRLNDQNGEFNCPVIEVVDTLIKEITIKFTIPVIFQLNDDKYKPDLLRQTFSGDSKLCTIGKKDEPLKRKFGNCLKLNGTTFRFTSIE